MSSFVPLLASLVCVLAVPAATVTVTTTADEVNGNTTSIAALLAAPGGAGISLREAVIAANNTPGADVITLPAGTYTLTLPNAGGLNEDACLTGDLDVTDSLTITGAGAASTIVQAGTTAANGIDKVLAINPLCNHAVAFAMSGVTIRFGRNTQPYGAGDFSFTGGGMDWCGSGASMLTLTDCVISDNNNVNGYGGGLNIDELAPATGIVNISNTRFVNNTSTYWGGGLNVFGDDVQVTLSACTIAGNQTLGTGGVGAQGGGINVRITGQTAGTTPSVTINNNSAITNNTAHGYGGGVCLAGSGNQNVTIQNSSIVGNTVLNNGAIASFGGGIYHDGNVSKTTTLNNVLIANNHADTLAGAAGGGLFVASGSLTMTYSRIVNNTAPTGKGAAQTGGTATAINNWWGTNAPAALMSGPVAYTPWLQLNHTASPSTIAVGSSATLTASFLTNSAGTAIPVANLGVLIGLPITFGGAVKGTISGAQTTIQASGTATATFNAGIAPAAGSAKATVDNATAIAAITVVCPTINGAVSGGGTICAGDSTNVTVTITGGFPPYTVTLNNGGGTKTNASPLTFTLSPGGTTTYAVSSATDSNGCAVTMSGSATVTVSAIPTPPTIGLSPTNPCPNQPGPQALGPAGAATYAWTITNGTITSAANLKTISYTPGASGNVGLTLRISNASGCTASSSTNVPILVDTIAPTIHCPTNITLTTTGNCPAIVSFSISATDNCNLTNLVVTPGTGSSFPVGTNLVNALAQDAAGNSNTCSFTVTVLAGAPPNLTAQLSPDLTNVVVSWPAAFGCYTLQSTPTLLSPQWSNDPGTVVTSGGSRFVTNSPAVGNRFFRLAF